MSSTRVPVYLRAYMEPERKKKRGKYSKKPVKPKWPETVIVFDTETTIDPSQRLIFGSYRKYRRTEDGRLTCYEEGIFHDDDLPVRDPAGYQLLREYVENTPADTAEPSAIRLMSRREFVNGRFYLAAYEAEALVGGFNLPFDLTRLAVTVGDARGDFRGGFSLTLFDYHDEVTDTWQETGFRPRVRIQYHTSKRSFISFGKRRFGSDEERAKARREGREHIKGRFLDVRTLAFALSSEGHSLASACKAFGVEQGKQEVEEHGRITCEYIDYNRADVRATAQLLEKLKAEFDRHPIDLAPDQAYSPASIGKAYLRAMGIVPPPMKFNLPLELQGHVMNTYSAGRSEVNVRLVGVPVVYCDFLSMYPTINTLMGNWDILIARDIQTPDATEEVRELLASIEADDVFDPALWPKLRFFARIIPRDDILPVRAEYDPNSNARTIGHNYLDWDRPIWVAGPDLVASVLLTGKVPEVLEAFSLEAVGTQEGLKPVEFAGEVTINPTRGDFFKTIIEERKRLNAGAMAPADRKRLDVGLKVLANSTSYGIFVEVNPDESTKARSMHVAGLDAEFTLDTERVEKPGTFFFAPLATLITSGARLMLAVLEFEVTKRGGTYAFCDTDSMAIVASKAGGDVGVEPARALTWDEVDAIVEKFDRLKPYDPDVVTDHVLEIEGENFLDGEREQLYVLAISAKRYALYNRTGDSSRIRKCSEHGLGHLMAPCMANERPWIKELWYALICKELGISVERPVWFDQPAVSQVGVTTPHMAKPFETFNEGKGYGDQIKPMNFVLSGQVAKLGYPAGIDPESFHPIAPFTADPDEWLSADWVNRHTGAPCTVETRTGIPPDHVRLKSIEDVYEAYRRHPEPKKAGSDGEPCGRQTLGLLQRRRVTPEGTPQLIGKEAHRWEDVQKGLIDSRDEVETRLDGPGAGAWEEVVEPFLREHPKERIAEATGISARSITRYRRGHCRPHPKNREKLLWLARYHAANGEFP